MRNDAHQLYTYKVRWSEEDKEFIATCNEFPSLSWLDEMQDKALNGINLLVKDVIEDMGKNNEDIPQPLATRHYSGKFMIRISTDLHRSLTIDAAEQNVSLNQLAAYRLATC